MVLMRGMRGFWGIWGGILADLVLFPLSRVDAVDARDGEESSKFGVGRRDGWLAAAACVGGISEMRLFREMTGNGSNAEGGIGRQRAACDGPARAISLSLSLSLIEGGRRERGIGGM